MITYDKENKIITLELAASNYVIGLAENQPICLYWGSPLHAADLRGFERMGHHSSFDRNVLLERSEYPIYDGRTFQGNCLYADYPLLFNVTDVEYSDDHLMIRMKDPKQNAIIELRYQLYFDHDVIIKTVRLTCGETPMIIRRYLSGSITLPVGKKEYHANYLCGAWANEFRPRSTVIKEGTFRIESTRGLSGPHFNPSLVLDSGEGQSYAALLEWSGSWQITVEKTNFGNISLRSGWNDQDFVLNLQPGESIESPAMYLCYAAGDANSMSRKLHRYQLEKLAPPKRQRRILYNSWEATYFDVHVERQKQLATMAGELGVELFVVDDGWFGERWDDKAGLGDWQVNAQKFPQGLGSLIDHVKKQGMEFGIWVEPESVNPNSNLYREHPDWVYQLDGIEPLQLRNQYLLNFGKQEVESFALKMLVDLLQQNDISYLKWDMNRTFTDIAENVTPFAREKHLQAVYRILEVLEKDFPNVDIETCSGGGARVDLGMIRRTGQFWPSDNTDPYDRLSIQDGCAKIYPAQLTSCWVTESGQGTYGDSLQDLDYRFHVSMSGGSLGLGANIAAYTDEQKERSKKLVSQYKEVRHLIHNGDRYSFGDPRRDEYHYVQYVKANRTEFVVFIFRGSERSHSWGNVLQMQGLSPTSIYSLNGSDVKLYGDTLMQSGLPVSLTRPFSSVCLHFIQDVPKADRVH